MKSIRVWSLGGNALKKEQSKTSQSTSVLDLASCVRCSKDDVVRKSCRGLQQSKTASGLRLDLVNSGVQILSTATPQLTKVSNSCAGNATRPGVRREALRSAAFPEDSTGSKLLP